MTDVIEFDPELEKDKPILRIAKDELDNDDLVTLTPEDIERAMVALGRAPHDDVLMLEPEDIQRAMVALGRAPEEIKIEFDLTANDSEQHDFYHKMKSKVKSWAQGKGRSEKYVNYILFAPDLFLLLVDLLKDPRVAPEFRTSIMWVVAYFISPLDLLPEAFFGPVGYLDDVVATSLVILRLLRSIDTHIIQEHWRGEGDIADVVTKISRFGEMALQWVTWKRLKEKANASQST